jgi:hypothetical protein
MSNNKVEIGSIKIPLKTYFMRFFDVFYDFVDAIKSLDPTIEFWIYGGAFRKAMHNKSLSSDIDLYVSSYEDFKKLSDVLYVMGFSRDYQRTSYYGHTFTLFGRNNIKIDLIKSWDIFGKAWKSYHPDLNRDNFNSTGITYELSRLTFLSPLNCLYWNDFTNSAILYDNNHNLLYLNEFFVAIETHTLEVPKFRDLDFIKNKMINHQICKEIPRYKYVVSETIDFMCRFRDINKAYYRAKKFIKDEGYMVKPEDKDTWLKSRNKEWDVKSQKHVDASEEIPEFVGWLPTDIADGFECEEFFENVETIFRDIFINDKDVVNHMEKNIKKVNLEKLLLSDKEEKLY